MSRMIPPFDPARDEDEQFEVVSNDEPSMEDYPEPPTMLDALEALQRSADESALIEREAEWATEAEAEEARLREWGVK